MLPQNSNNPRTIHINPNFKGQQNPPCIVDRKLVSSTTNPHQATAPPPHLPANAHINPLFLEQAKRPTIHMNPRFLLKLQEQKSLAIDAQPTTNLAPTLEQGRVSSDCMREITADPGGKLEKGDVSCVRVSSGPTESRKIICKSKNRLIREPIVLPQKPLIVKPSSQPQPIIVVTKRKLIRKSATATPLHTVSSIQALKVNPDVVGTKTIKTKYKLDNRVVRKKLSTPNMTKIKRKSFVGRFALLRRNSTNLPQSASAMSWSKSASTATTKSPNIQSMNKKLQLLNINGLLYKSTRNTLKLKDLTNTSSHVPLKSKKTTISQDIKPSPGLTIFVRGTKYVMDPQKFKLTRVSGAEKENPSYSHNSNATRCSRIDIGGFTYVSASSARNVLIRTRNHLARAYVNNAKQKSLQVLAKRLVKSNVPCPIYQRVGKCAAFERGKCLKVHNKLQVAICPKFLRGECVNSKCLLSHDVSLSKMPVCKFYMQGVCVRNDCPYLHKKLSNNAEICIEFLRGFCHLADKCNKRHEFVCPELERSGSCTIKNCLYCKSKLKREKYLEKTNHKVKNNDSSKVCMESAPALPTAAAKQCPEKSTTGLRYFIGGSEEEIKPNIINDDEDLVEVVQNVDSTEAVTATAPGDGFRKRPKLGDLPAFIPL